MSKRPPGVGDEELTQAARRVLLDALTALAEHREALTVVGAQAVYLRTSGARIRSAAYTADGDISIDPDALGRTPHLEEAMHAAGFSLRLDKNGNQMVGLWQRTEQIGDTTFEAEVDLLVPKTLALGSQKGRRTQMPPHDPYAALKVRGLEAAAVDRSLMTITSLDAGDTRQIEAYVAGPAALLIAKAYKLHERVEAANNGKPERLSAKDAADVYRIMTAVPVAEVAAAFRTLTQDDRIGEIATQGLVLLTELFGAAATPGTDLAVEALAGDIPEARIRALSPLYTSQLA
ncbi:hypothetical protein OG458_42840 (plasmid) [Streptomyces sp. NBC_01281]|uniref:hypothetical protein n=1 Tax=Streptomyces sp. NBC_01281 TaxID=2903811 RepID=UPI002E0F0073|nr:hypothetical protein OG458_42840 [Streptomyces sp. NBC_01281]